MANAGIRPSGFVILSSFGFRHSSRVRHRPARPGHWLLAGRWRLDELAVQLGPARAEVTAARRLLDLLGREQADDDVIAERLALDQRLAERVEDHRQAGLDRIVIDADRVRE